MTPWLDDGDVHLYLGDALAVLRELPDESVDCVVTSPPYWGLRDYGTGQWDGGDPECDHGASRARKREELTDGGCSTWSTRDATVTARDTCAKCGAQRTDQQLGLEPTPDQFVTAMVQVFREVRRVLAAHGTCWVNLGDSYASGEIGRNDNTSLSSIPLPRGASGSLVPSGGRHTRGGASDRPRHERRLKQQTGLKPKDLCGVPWRVAFALQQPYYTGHIKSEADRIWLAAMVDAEGCMFIHRRKAGQKNGQGYERKSDTFGAGLEVSSTDRAIVERCMAIAGIGSICEQSPEQNARRKQTIYRWNARTNACRDVIRELYPHLVAKQHEARLLLGCPSSGDDARKAWESLKALHQGQGASIDFPPPEGMWERGWFLRSEIIWAKLCPTLCPNP